MTSAQRSIGTIAQTAVSYSYSAVGNLTNKSDFGTNYLYTDPLHKHGVKQVSLVSGGTMNYNFDENGNVIARGKNSVFNDTFGYDIDNRPQFTQIVTNKSGTSRIDFYLSATGAKALQVAPNRVTIYAGAYEAEYNSTGGLVASRTYLAEGVFHNGVGDALQTVGLSFMHQDRLGSALVITDKGGRNESSYYKNRIWSATFKVSSSNCWSYR
jgi:hypothetical protein